MEAAWLAAIIVTPVFFNVFSSRIFEPDKLALLRTLALISLGAWVVKIASEGGFRWERVRPGKTLLETLRQIPLIAPVLALVFVYLVSTLFSITPKTSFWGSYQRFQGTYTTFSYLVIFATMVTNLRRRAQVERLISAAIFSSLPISLYGIMQRFKIDPVPWGGDVSVRIAANLGNSIFLAAYLIMVFPLTMVRILDSFRALLKGPERIVANFSRATVYVFIIALQSIAIYFTGSRGPWLGWLVSSFFLFVVLTLVWRKRQVTFAVVGFSAVVMVFLLVLNIPNGPLESLRSRPEFARIGKIFDAESRTGRVRTLIWQGAAELVGPHEPIGFPDGRVDNFNVLRPLIGYGPEAMYVAYNRFYPAELTQVEKRNASPDRSHNETWDSLVMTGVLGLLVYLVLFASVFYYGLKWLGLITNKPQRNLYLGLYAGGGVLGAVIMVAWKGIGYFGVGMPFGILGGLVIYLMVVALFGRYESPKSDQEMARAVTMLGFLAVIVAHFAETNFGIAIAATRTYFWSFTAALILVGYVLPLHGEYAGTSESFGSGVAKPEKASQRNAAAKSKRRAVRTRTHAPARGMPAWLREALIGGVIVGLLIGTLGYNFITNAQGGDSASSVIWSSLARLRSAGSGFSFGLLAMILTTWLVGSIGFTSESESTGEGMRWLSALAVTLVVSLLVGVLFWLSHANGLVNLSSNASFQQSGISGQIDRSIGLLTRYYIFLYLVIFGLAALLPAEWPVNTQAINLTGAVTAGIALVVVFYLAAYTNLRVIQADIVFKLADPFSRSGNWPVAIAIYDRANELAPTEDYYYLFLGRAYLEQAKDLSDPAERDKQIAQAASDLKNAQAINPLNTDHTANLARLYSLWASYTSDAALKQERAVASDSYFSEAVKLSPNNARLWDEWSLLYLNVFRNTSDALARMQKAKEIDPFYDWTYGLLGDYYVRTAQDLPEEQQEQKQELLAQASEMYNRALELAAASDTQTKYSYALALGGVESQRAQPTQAIAAYQQAIQLLPSSTDKWRIEEAIARLYYETGDRANAVLHAQNALAAAPEDQKDRLTAFLAQLSGSPD